MIERASRGSALANGKATRRARLTPSPAARSRLAG